MPRGRGATTGGFAAGSTGDRYTKAGERDDLRMSTGSTGGSKHQFEHKARQARIDWRAGTKTLTSLDTPYGKINLSKFPTKDPGPKITTLKADYNNTSVGHKYTELAAVLIDSTLGGIAKATREKEVAEELLKSIETGTRPAPADRKIADGQEANAAAKLLAISHISEPERVGGSSKDFRRVLTQIRKGKRTFEEAFGGNGTDPPTYLMAKSPTAARRALGQKKYKKAHPPSSFRGVDSDYSGDSS